MGYASSPLEQGKLVCAELMNRYRPADLPPKGVFFYHQGVFLSGMQQLYLICGERKYFDYIKQYVDTVLFEDGEIVGYSDAVSMLSKPPLAQDTRIMLDHKQPVILLYNLYEETGDAKYLNAVKVISRSMLYWPVNRFGGYWHMITQPYQMWLDSAYMAGPLSVMYAKWSGDPVLRERAVNQILLMNRYMKDEKTGLYYHGWDDSKREPWADPRTGLSSQIWGRAVGWYAVAILDILEYLPSGHPEAEHLVKIELDLLRALLQVQDSATGMWYQILDKPEREDNWVETSCTCLFAYSLAKAIRMGYAAEEEFAGALKKAWQGLQGFLRPDENGNLVVENICIGTCIDEGDYAHYIGRSTVKNDLHGAGAFLLMCAELEKVKRLLD